MNIWTHALMTTAGLDLQSKLMAGQTLTITKVVAGSGSVAVDDLANQTAVTNPEVELSMNQVRPLGDGECLLPVYLLNNEVTNAFNIKQIGVYATDPDDGEILYFITQTDDQSDGEHVPSKTEMPAFSIEWFFKFSYGNADSVTVTIDPAGLVTRSEGEILYLKNQPADGVQIAGTYPNLTIVDGSITTDMLSEEAKSALVVVDGSITTEKLADGAVTDGKIGARTIDDTTGGTANTATLTNHLKQIYAQLKKIKGTAAWSTTIQHNLSDFYYCNEPGTTGYVAPTGTQWIAYKGGGFVAQKVIGAYMADYAEYMNVVGLYKIGDIVCIDPTEPRTFKISGEDCNNRIAGVVSDKYFICTGREDGSTNVPVGLIGRVPVNVVGRVKIGDMIVNSDIPGAGRSLADGEPYKPGIIVGQALENKDDDEIGQIEILLKRG